MKRRDFFSSTAILLLLFFSLSLCVDAQQTALPSNDTLLHASVVLNAKSNFANSPYTGYTRQHWLRITEKIIAGALAHISAKTGMPEFSIPPNDTAFERLRWKAPAEAKKRVLERMMIAVIIYTKATGKDVVPGYSGSISQPFIRAIIRGTNPADSNYWGDPLPNDQVGSVFALAAYIEPQRWWQPLTAVQKTNLLQYLKKLAYVSTYDNNHYFFHMAPVALLDKNGTASNRAQLTKMYERLMGWYRGDGWFLDGNNRTFDYYNLWGFRLFNQVLYRYDTAWKRQFGKRIQQTTASFLQTMPYLYGRDGGPIPWGRSLAYRFAGNAAIAWAALNGMRSLPPGQARRIASGSLKYFWEHGCMDSTGLLTIGYWGANASVAETYLFYGDPYWANHGLSPLLIPENDPFWTAKELPIPADEKGGRKAVTGAEFTIRVSATDGEARLFPIGQPLAKDRTIWQGGAKYDQHACSGYLGFCLNGDDGGELGAGRSGYSYDGTTWFYRQRAKLIQLGTHHAISRYTLRPAGDSDATPDYNRDEMMTHTLIGNDGEVHIFWHNHPEPLYLYLGGYGISAGQDTTVKEKIEKNSRSINAGSYHSIITAVQAPGGTFESTLLTPRPGWSSTHLFGGAGAFPYWHSTQPVPPNMAVIFYVNGTKNRKPVMSKVQVTKTGNHLAVSFEGKTYHIMLPF